MEYEKLPLIVLDPIQELAVNRMYEKNRYCLFWDVGVGKTYPVLARLAKFTTMMKVLILAPAISVENMWSKEQEDDWFGVFNQHDVEIRSFEWFAWNKGAYYVDAFGKRKRRVIESNISELRHKSYDVIIIDEAHRLAASQKQSRTARLVSRLTATAGYVYCLTGTPARNGYQDLYPLFKNANMNVWGDLTYNEFLMYYFKGYNLNLPYGTVFKPTDLKPNRMDEFFNAIDPYCMFVKKERDGYQMDVLEIEVQPNIIPEYVDALRGIYTDASGEQQTVNSLVGFGKAYMALNGFQYVLGSDGNNQTVEYFENPKVPYLLNVLRKEFANTRCIVVYYNFKRDFKTLTEVFRVNNIAWTDDFDNANARTDKFVYMLQLKKGISINLQKLSNVAVFYTYNFSFADYDQSIGRVDRRGQGQDVRIYRLVFAGSIEKRIILRAIDTKQRIDHTLKTKVAHRIISKEIATYGYTRI